MTDEEQQSGPRLWMYWAGGGVVVLLLLLLLMTRGGEEVAPRASGGNGAPSVDREFCRSQLEATLEALEPTELDISSRAVDMADDLNIWWTECGETAGELATVETESLSLLLAEESVARVVADEFDDRDAAHIRNCILYRAQAESIVPEVVQEFRIQERDGAPQRLDRVRHAFQYVVRQIAALPAGASGPPLPCEYAALFGRAEPRYRAWLFAEVLRQFRADDRVDCVIIEPAGTDAGEDLAGAWLVGVIVAGEGVYLFDPTAGVAIPGASDEEDAAGESRPATLREVRSNDELLRRLDVPGGPAYPWTAESLQHIRVKVIGEACQWSPRMARFQNQLPGGYSMTLFDGLTDSPYRTMGLVDRVREAGGGELWDEDDVSVWGFPQAQIAAFYAAGGEDDVAIAERMRVLDAPRQLRRNREGNLVEMNSNRPLRLYRMQHLSGKLLDALRGYGAIRSAAAIYPIIVNELAKEDAVYWIGLCQYQLHREETALSNLDLYVREYPAGIWLGAVRTLRAHCFARLGRYEEAAEALLETGASGSSLSFGEAFLLRQWQGMAAAVKTNEEH